MTAAAPNPSPLTGLRVLDFTRVLSGPFAGRMLCDLGADVVKVEPPEGDITRLWGRSVSGIAGFFNQQNAGKRSICLDLRHARARDLAFELIGHADILLENFRSDVMPRLGVGYDDLKAVNPRLIMLSISGFGRGGPQSRRPAYAPVIHAETGLLHRSARMSPTGEAQDIPWSAADTNAALHGLVAVLAAVILRESTGLGQHIDIAMLDTALVTDDNLHFDLEHSGDMKGPPPEIWRSGAGSFLISADFRHLWRRLQERHGVTDPAGPNASLADKIRLRHEAVAAFLATLRTWGAVERAMDQMNIAWGEVYSGDAMEGHPTVQARGSIVQIDDRSGGTRPIPQSPYRFSGATSRVRGPAAYLGEDNAEVLREWLGMSDAAVADLAHAGVLRQGVKVV